MSTRKKVETALKTLIDEGYVWFAKIGKEGETVTMQNPSTVLATTYPTVAEVKIVTAQQKLIDAQQELNELYKETGE